jgi:hypothetical protein
VLLATASAQSITLTNPTGCDWRGYVRGEASTPAAAAGWHAVTHRPTWAVVASEGGRSTIDVWAEVPAGATQIVDLAASQAVVRPLPVLGDIGAQHAGQPLIGGQGVTYAAPEVGGAGVVVRGHAIVGEHVVTMAATIYPETPAHVTVRLTATPWHPLGSNQAVTMVAPISLSWGDGQVWGPAGGSVIWPSGTTTFSGAPVATEAVVFWPRLSAGNADLQAAQAARLGGLLWSAD